MENKIKEIMNDLFNSVYNNCQTIGGQLDRIIEAFVEATSQLIELKGGEIKNEK